MARLELRSELGRAGAPGHPEDGLGGRGVHGPQLVALLPPYAAGVGTAPQSVLLLRVEETAGPRWLAATGTAVWPAAATAAEEEEEVSARAARLRFLLPGWASAGEAGAGEGGSSRDLPSGSPGSQEQG